MLNLSKRQLECFEEQGFLVAEMPELMDSLLLLRKSIEKLLDRYMDFPESVRGNVNAKLIKLYQHNPNALIDVQRIITKSPLFASVSASTFVNSSVCQLLGVDFDNPLYLLSNCVVMEFPTQLRDTQNIDFHTKWHDDLFWTIPNSRYVHIWIPLLNDADHAIGSLKVCKGSHKDDWHGRHVFNGDAQFNYRYGIRSEVVDRYEVLDVPVKFGQILFFHPHLIHSSGENSTNDRVRVTMLGLYHDATQKACVPLTPHMKFIGKTPEQWFYELYEDKNIKPIVEEQLDAQGSRPSGI